MEVSRITTNLDIPAEMSSGIENMDEQVEGSGISYSQILDLSTSLSGQNETGGEVKDVEERQKWLREAFDGIVVNVPLRMKAMIERLSVLDPDDCCSDVENIIEQLTEYCYDMNYAKDFYKLGGHTQIYRYFLSKNCAVVVKALTCLVVMVQNFEELQIEVSKSLNLVFDVLHQWSNHRDVTKAVISLFSSLSSNCPDTAVIIVSYLECTLFHQQPFDSQMDLQRKMVRLVRTLQTTVPHIIKTVIDTNYIRAIIEYQYDIDIAETVCDIIYNHDFGNLEGDDDEEDSEKRLLLNRIQQLLNKISPFIEEGDERYNQIHDLQNKYNLICK